MPNPGDAGSSLGSAARVYGRKINWVHTFLGTNIKGSYPVKRGVDLLLSGHIVGIANGKAEFGPRALGNRSLIADPRGNDIKDRVNVIKKRQKFRPFAPSVLEEHAHEIFDLPVERASYMQFTAKCKYPERYPAICHVDGTSRVQTINRKENRGYYDLIKKFYISYDNTLRIFGKIGSDPYYLHEFIFGLVAHYFYYPNIMIILLVYFILSFILIQMMNKYKLNVTNVGKIVGKSLVLLVCIHLVISFSYWIRFKITGIK